MASKKTNNLGSDIQDFALSVLPELSGALTPEVVSDPVGVLVKVSGSILASKLSKFYQEFREKRQNGEVPEDLDEIQDSLLDILNFIQENPTNEKLEAAKKLFFISILPGTEESEQQLAFEMMQTCKRLSSNDLLVLKAAYEIATTNKRRIELSHRVRAAWFKEVAMQIGHNLSSLVESSEENLQQLKLITIVEPRDETHFHPGGTYRLTDFGYKLCQYLSS